MSTLTEALPEVSRRDKIMDLERQYLLQNYARYPLVLHRGKGPALYDVDGKRYLDFISGIGVNALGHAHPRIVEGHSRTGSAADPLLESLLPRVPGTAGRTNLAKISGLQRSFFCN